MTEPNHLAERIAQLRARLSPEGERFFAEYERRSDAVSTGYRTDLDSMADSAWTTEQLKSLPAEDRAVVMEAMQLHARQVWGGATGEEIVDEMIEQAHADPDSARTLIAWAEQLQVYAGEPLLPNMDVKEAGDVLRRLLFDRDV